MSEHNFQEDLALNRFDLDSEAAKQPSLYQYWSEQLADAKAEKDRLDSQLKVRRAEIEIQIRQEAAANGTKLTEAMVTALVTTNVEILDRENAVREQQRQVAIIQSGVAALEQKKSMIETVSRLWVSGYYSAPSDSDGGATSQRSRLNRKSTEEE